jgi:enoyl-[acyl-carrier protein] reductase II
MTPNSIPLEIPRKGMERLDALWARGQEFLGCRYAILGGAMTWVSDHGLVAAISNAGGFGVLATGAMLPEQLDAEIAATRLATDKPFGVNIILMHPQLAELTDVCTSRGVSHVVLAGGLPKREHIARVKDGGAKAIGFAPALSIAKRLVGFGVDAIVIEGAEAGGHTGPVSTSVLAQEILPHMVDVPVFVAGGIGRGEAIAMYLEMGAAGCQLGTRFVCATESIAHADFKRAFFRASARDAVLSIQLDPLFPVIPVRALANSGTKRFQEIQREAIGQFRSGSVGLVEAQLVIEKFWAGQLRAAVIDGDVENGSLMAGQSVGMVSVEQTTLDIIADLVDQAASALE